MEDFPTVLLSTLDFRLSTPTAYAFPSRKIGLTPAALAINFCSS